MNTTMHDPRLCDECEEEYDLAAHPWNTELCPGCAADPMTWTEAYENFDAWLNDVHPTIELVGSEYDPSRVLWEVDPAAYREAFNNWADSEGIETDELIGPDADA